MYGYKLGWIILAIVLIILVAVIGVGIYQLNAEGNPWNFWRKHCTQRCFTL